MSTREPRPDALVIGAPKAGTSALHAALAQHPQVYASPVKEPKYYMCTDAPPPAYRGPGDAHSQQEWVWRAEDYAALFDAAPAGSVRLESTPFYLYLRSSRRRIAEELPDPKFVVIVRDPVDRAVSNWVHLRADGLEPEPDFLTAVEREEQRIADGWAPFWHYRALGRYGSQLRDLLAHVPREQVLLLRYRHLVDQPTRTLDRVCTFLGVAPGRAHTVPPQNVKPHVADGLRYRVVSRAVRAGAAAGAHLPPEVWRWASRPLIAALHAARTPRGAVSVEVRRQVLDPLRPDIDLLEELTGESFADWKGDTGRGDFRSRSTAHR
jgi:hypothetical protein